MKFEGCYHGHGDSLLVKAGSGALTFGVPTSPGVPPALAEHTLTLGFNDAGGVRDAFAKLGERIAAVIVEPVAGNMNCVPPVPGFLETLRECCDAHGAVLIFDEVMTGFRVAPGGAQALYGVRPDLTTLGKVIGGRHAGRRLRGTGRHHGHHRAGRPGVPGGHALRKPDRDDRRPDHAGDRRRGRVPRSPFGDDEPPGRGAARTRVGAAGVGLATNHVCGMFGLFFTDAAEVDGFAGVMACDTERFARFFHAMLEAGVYLAPSAFEAGFVSSAHADEHLETTFRAAERAFEVAAARAPAR